MVYAIKVKKPNAEKIRKKLLKKDLLNSEWSIIENGDFLIFPLKKKIDGAIKIDLPPRKRRLSPYEKIKRELGRNISIPDYWEKLGEVIILPPFNEYKVYGEIVGRVFANVLKAKTVIIYKGTKGELRIPDIEILYGESTETIHKENGIYYKLDVANIMFSSGNIKERIRMSKIRANGEIVVDLFAGIGYFTLPIAKYGNAKKVYACEKNPIAIKYLLDNIQLNSLKNIIPLLGDNRKNAPFNIADRVIMGYINTKKFLDIGFKVLKKSGGILHYHDTFTTEEVDWKPDINIKKYAEINGYKPKILYKNIIKSYAPHIWHVVVDCLVRPKIK